LYQYSYGNYLSPQQRFSDEKVGFSEPSLLYKAHQGTPHDRQGFFAVGQYELFTGLERHPVQPVYEFIPSPEIAYTSSPVIGLSHIKFQSFEVSKK
jgi:hypothetical protein